MSLPVRFLASLSGLRIHVAMSCGEGHGLGSDLTLLWLWHGLEATAPIQLLAWEPPYATNAALKSKYIYDTNEFSVKQKTDSQLVIIKGKGFGGGMEWEFGISGCKLLYRECINKVLVCGTGNYIQYPIINHRRI